LVIFLVFTKKKRNWDSSSKGSAVTSDKHRELAKCPVDAFL